MLWVDAKSQTALSMSVCEMGMYQNDRGKSSGKACLQGRYQDGTGQSDYQYSTPETSQNMTGGSKCLLCSAVVLQWEGSKCLLCPAVGGGEGPVFYYPTKTGLNIRTVGHSGVAIKCKMCSKDI